MSADAVDGPSLRVLSWNVRSLRDGRRGVVAVIRSCAADVVVLQEAPRLLGWRLSRWWLARACGLRVASRAWSAGNVVLVRPGLPVVRAEVVRVPRRPGLHRRSAVLVTLQTTAGPLVVCGTHLDLDPAARLDTAARVRSAIGDRTPALVGADVNDVPGSPAWCALVDGLVDPGTAPTFPARAPTRRIDALLVSPDVAVSSYAVIDERQASDHRPLLARLSL